MITLSLLRVGHFYQRQLLWCTNVLYFDHSGTPTLTTTELWIHRLSCGCWATLGELCKLHHCCALGEAQVLETMSSVAEVALKAELVQAYMGYLAVA